MHDAVSALSVSRRKVAVLENGVAAVTAATSSARKTPEQVAMKQVNQS